MLSPTIDRFHAPWLLAGALLVCGCLSASAQAVDGTASRSEAAQLANQYIDRFVEQQRLTAQVKERRAQIARLETAGGGPADQNALAVLGNNDPATSIAFEALLQTKHRPGGVGAR